jgi:hypothetical protein
MVMKSLSSLGLKSLVAGAALALAGGVALAEERAAPELPEAAEAAAERGAPELPEAGAEADRADPIAQTLPSVASEIAVANAFGQRGEIERAARDLARAAAADEAAAAARELAAELAAEGRATGENARAAGADNAARGLDRSQAARGEDRRPDLPTRP